MYLYLYPCYALPRKQGSYKPSYSINQLDIGYSLLCYEKSIFQKKNVPSAIWILNGEKNGKKIGTK